jgi:hypothetical protein
MSALRQAIRGTEDLGLCKESGSAAADWRRLATRKRPNESVYHPANFLGISNQQVRGVAWDQVQTSAHFELAFQLTEGTVRDPQRAGCMPASSGDSSLRPRSTGSTATTCEAATQAPLRPIAATAVRSDRSGRRDRLTSARPEDRESSESSACRSDEHGACHSDSPGKSKQQVAMPWNPRTVSRRPTAVPSREKPLRPTSYP